MTYQEKPFDFGQFISYLIVFFFLVCLITCGTGCHIQQRIEQAKLEAVKLDRLENPCINDSIKILIPGETSIIHDTTETLWHDSIYNWTYDTIRINRTIRRTDTIQVTVKDIYLINSLKDSINVHKRIESHYLGQLEEKTTQLSDEKKNARRWQMGFLGICALLVSYVGVRFYFSLKFHL